MARVPILTIDTASPATQANLSRIEKAFGKIPNMFGVVANSPAALQSMWGSFGVFSTGALGAALTEQIAVAVADTNDCSYCLAAHTALGAQAGLSTADLATAQQGRSDDPSIDALLQFARSLVEQRGQVAEGEITKLRDLGWTDSQIVETIAQVGLNLFTNYINIALDVPVDFPEVPFQR